MENGFNLILAGLQFSKTKIAEACEDKKNTTFAVVLIAISVILDTVIAFFQGNGGSSGLGRMGLTGINAAIGELGSVLVGTFLSVLIMVYVIRIFKVKPTYDEILRVYGAAIIWTILGSIVGLLLGPSFVLTGIAFWLAYNFALMFGLAGYTKIKIWQAFVSIVLTFIGVFIVMMVYGVLIKAVFA